MARRLDGFLLIALATAVAGVLGYLVTWFVYRQIGPGAYSLFAVYWATLYLLVGGLSGIQQEMTRATRFSEPGRVEPRGWGSARRFALIAASLVLVVVIATSPAWAPVVFPSTGAALVLPLAVGAAANVLVVSLAGTLYGLTIWRPLGVLIALDGVLRLSSLAIALQFTHDLVVLAWLVSLPFPAVVLVVWLIARRRIIGRSFLDVGYRALTWNVARTVLASISTAVLVSGFPLLLGIAGQGQSPALVGEVIFTITLIRAPLIITVMSFQSFFVVRFRDHPESRLRTFVGLLGIIGLGAVVLGALGWLFGVPVLEIVSGMPSSLNGGLIALLVGSSALVAAMCVTAPALLARGEHLGYSAGWVAAAIATAIAMALPIEFLPRVELAVLIGPVVGLLVHGVWLIATRKRPIRLEFS